jgi:hypothetical protein
MYLDIVWVIGKHDVLPDQAKVERCAIALHHFPVSIRYILNNTQMNYRLSEMEFVLPGYDSRTLSIM